MIAILSSITKGDMNVEETRGETPNNLVLLFMCSLNLMFSFNFPLASNESNAICHIDFFFFSLFGCGSFMSISHGICEREKMTKITKITLIAIDTACAPPLHARKRVCLCTVRWHFIYDLQHQKRYAVCCPCLHNMSN